MADEATLPVGSVVDDELAKRLQETYPDFQKVTQNVQVYLDIAESDREALIGPPTNSNEPQASSDIDRGQGALNSGVKESKYLQKGVAESDVDYKKRLAETEPFLTSPKLLAYVVASIYNPEPHYTGVDEYRGRMASVNGYEQSYVQAMMEVCDTGLVCGFAFMLVDSTRTPEMGAMTKAQADAKGVRPILTTYDPLGIRDWEYDDKGLSWVHLFKTQTCRSSPMEKRKTVGVHTIADRQKIDIYEETKEAGGKKKITFKSSVRHNMGEVPGEFLLFVQQKKKKRGVGRSFIHGSSRADLAGLRAESYRAISLQVHGTPHLWRRLSSDEWEMMTQLRATTEAGTENPKPIDYAFVAGQMQLGYSGYHIFVGEGSDMGYATLDTGGIEQFRVARDDAHRAAMEHAGFDPAAIRAGSEGSNAATAQSGVAKAYGFEMNQGVQIKFLSNKMAEFDAKILEKYIRTAGGSPDDIMVNYPPPTVSVPFSQVSDELEVLETHGYPDEIKIEGYIAAMANMSLFLGKNPEAMASLVEIMKSWKPKGALANNMVEQPKTPENDAA